MFNDLQANQSAPTTPSVDDIFAETDKPVTEAKSFSGYYNQSPANSVSSPAPTEIETQKAGLSASDGAASPSKSKILKISKRKTRTFKKYWFCSKCLRRTMKC